MKAILSEEQRTMLYDHLKDRANYQTSQELKDVYFCRKEVQSFDELAMADIGSYSLRLRTYSQDGVTHSELNTKEITQYDDHHAWEEHETTVTSFEETKAILKTIGFKDFFTIEKTRHTFTEGDTTINVEDIKGFKPVIEVEIMTTKEGSERAKEKIITLFKSLGIPPTQIVPKSITHILMRERVSF